LYFSKDNTHLSARYSTQSRREFARLKGTGNLILAGVTVEFTVLLSIAWRAVLGGESTAISFIFRRNAAAPRANKVLLMSSRHSYLTAS